VRGVFLEIIFIAKLVLRLKKRTFEAKNFYATAAALGIDVEILL
jgi:hypothetical protein